MCSLLLKQAPLSILLSLSVFYSVLLRSGAEGGGMWD